METIKFEWLGLHLQEPMAIISNLLIAALCFFAWFNLKRWNNAPNRWWRLFFLFFGISTIFGALGHAFYGYWGVEGKFPCWMMGGLANCAAAKAMFEFPTTRPAPYKEWLIWLRSGLMVALAISTQKFIFIAIDAIITYVFYTGVFGYILYRRGVRETRFMVYGVIILFPSAFIFLMKLNLHRWLNKDDLSHLLMLGCIFCFYLGMRAWGKQNEPQLSNG